MAVTQNTYTGNGSNTNFSITFEYLKQSDVKASIDGTATTAFTLSNATTLSFTTAPANGAAVRIFRDTDVNSLKATFFPGSAIKAEDLNDNFTQNNFATQETVNDVVTANTTANTAKTTADAATVTANSATATANAASALATTADTNASAAVSTANTASTDATTALNNSRESDGQGGFTSAISKATSATTTANTALTNSRESDGQGGFTSAISKANTALTNSSSAVTTANAASATATTASTNASNAVATANAASSAVANAAFYTPIAALANLPSSPANEDRVEMTNSTGVESSSAVSGVPAGFTGATTLSVRLQYNSSTSKWEYQQYFANDPDERYATSYLPVIKGDGTSSGQVGKITLNCSNNNHGVSLSSPPHSANATYNLTLPNALPSVAGQMLTGDTSSNLSWVTNQSNEITGGNNGSVEISLNSLNEDQLRTTLQNLLVRHDYHTHSFIYKPQYFSDDMEIRGNKTFRFQGNSGGGGFYTGFKKSTTATSSVDFTLPDADGSAGQAIVTDGSGVLSFADAGAPTLDGGNFNTGGSLVTTSNTIDGGSF